MKCLFYPTVLLLCFATALGAAEIRGKVVEVREKTVKIETQSDLAPQVGDKVKISFAVPDAGDVELEGVWRVKEVTAAYVTAEPTDSTSAATPQRDQKAVIVSDNPVNKSSLTPPPEVNAFGPNAPHMIEEVRVVQTSKKIGDRLWEWEIHLEGKPEDLDQVDRVVYSLHPTFPDPVRTVTDRPSGFKLQTSGWGTFQIKLVIYYKNGIEQTRFHNLSFSS